MLLLLVVVVVALAAIPIVTSLCVVFCRRVRKLFRGTIRVTVCRAFDVTVHRAVSVLGLRAVGKTTRGTIRGTSTVTISGKVRVMVRRTFINAVLLSTIFRNTLAGGTIRYLITTIAVIAVPGTIRQSIRTAVPASMSAVRQRTTCRGPRFCSRRFSSSVVVTFVSSVRLVTVDLAMAVISISAAGLTA